MKWLNNWIKKRRDKKLKKEAEEKEYYSRIAEVFSDYERETGKSATEFRMKMYDTTADFKEWWSKK